MKAITRNWNLARIIRLLIGLSAIVEGIRASTPFLVLAGGILALMAFAKAGCCDASACTIDHKSPEANRMKKETYATLENDITA